MEGKLGEKVLYTGSGGQEHLAFVVAEGDPATLAVLGPSYMHQKAPYRSKADGERDGAGDTYRSVKDR